MCKDPLVSFLAEYGYCLVKLPKNSIQPLQVLMKDKKDYLKNTNNLLVDFFRGRGYPSIQENIETADLQYQKSKGLNFKLGLDLFKNFLTSASGKIKEDEKLLKTALANAHEFVFSFDNTKEDQVGLKDLDDFITKATFEAGNTFLDKAKNNELYIITSVLKSNNFSVGTLDKSGNNIKASLPDIHNLVEGNIDINSKNSEDSEISFKAEEMLVFGFKAVRLYCIDTDKLSFRIENKDGLVLRSQDMKVEVFKTEEEAFIDL